MTAVELPADHHIVRLNQGVRETVLQPENGLPQPERGLFAAKVIFAAVHVAFAVLPSLSQAVYAWRIQPELCLMPQGPCLSAEITGTCMMHDA